MAQLKSKATIEKLVDWLGAVDQAALDEGCFFDTEAAEHVCQFFEGYLKHSTGRWRGQPFTLQKWQRRFLMRLFGWKRKNGLRRFRSAYIEVPKKNGKSTICAGIALYLLVADGEGGSQVYSVAVDKKQASIVFKEAANAVRASEELSELLTITASKWNIADIETGSWYEVLCGIAANSEGKNIHGLIFDELHAQKNRALFDALRYGGAARSQPLCPITITTAGYDRNSVCYEQHEYTKKVNEGIILDTSFFGLIYGASPEDDWTDPKTWRKANPSFGVTIDEEAFAAECKAAQETPALENAFKRYRLGIWTEQLTRWLSIEKWNQCGTEIDWTEYEHRSCFAALDLGMNDDLSALVLAFPEDDGSLTIKPFFWCASECATKKELKDRVPYLAWSKLKHITLTDGDCSDFDRIKADILDLAELYSIDKLAIDPMNASHVAQQLAGEGLDVVFFRQHFGRMNEPTRALERLVLTKRLRHDGNETLKWQASNVVIDSDSFGNIRPNKKKATDKIDGIVATIMAVGLVGEDEGSGYSEPLPESGRSNSPAIWGREP